MNINPVQPIRHHQLLRRPRKPLTFDRISRNRRKFFTRLPRASYTQQHLEQPIPLLCNLESMQSTFALAKRDFDVCIDVAQLHIVSWLRLLLFGVERTWTVPSSLRAADE